MKILYLFRHAKASPWTGGDDDHTRPLVRRGIRDAQAMGRHLARAGVAPEVVLCSSAARAVETWEEAVKEMREAPSPLIEDRLYDASATDLLKRVHHLDDTAASALLVGHNPALGELAGELAGAGDAALRETLARKFPAGAVAGLRFESDAWADLARGKGTLTVLATPKEMPKA